MRLYPLVPAPAATPQIRTYSSSLSDAEWAVLQPLVQRPAAPQGGRPPKHSLRRIIDAIRYLVRTGCAWRLLPREFPPPGTVYWWFAKWAVDGTLQRIHDVLRERVRVAAGRRVAPSAAIIDSQSVRAADTVPKHSRGWDAGKKVNGRKRHLAVDTSGLLLVVMVTAASVQDRDAARRLLWRLRVAYRGVRLVWADGGYGGKLVAWPRGRAASGGGDRPQAPWPIHFRAVASQVGGRADASLDQQAPPLCPRLRAPARSSRRDGHLGHGRGDDPTARAFRSTTTNADHRCITALRYSVKDISCS
jgi:transposase